MGYNGHKGEKRRMSRLYNWLFPKKLKSVVSHISENTVKVEIDEIVKNPEVSGVKQKKSGESNRCEICNGKIDQEQKELREKLKPLSISNHPKRLFVYNDWVYPW